MAVRWQRAKRRILDWLWDEDLDGPRPGSRPPEAPVAMAAPEAASPTVSAPAPLPAPAPAPPAPRSPPEGAPRKTPLPTSEIQFEGTPNPLALRFSAGRRLVRQGTLSWSGVPDHPVGARILAVDGVASAFVASDFLTITRRPDVHWGDLTDELIEILAEEAARAPWG